MIVRLLSKSAPRKAVRVNCGRTWPREKARRERDQPEQAEEYRDAGNDFGVDPAGLGPWVDVIERGEVVADDTGDDL